MFKKAQISIMSLILLIYIVTSFFIYPQADDYWYANKFLTMGYWGTLVNEYMTWNGRYVATTFLSGSPLVWGNLSWYRIMPILLITLLWASSVFLVRSIFKEKIRKGEDLFLGLALTYLTIMASHTISEGFYWLSSSYTYTFSLVFFNFGLGSFWKKNKTYKDYILVSIFSLLIIGSNETIMVLWLYTILVKEFIFYIERRRIRKGTAFVFLISLAAAIFVLTAPGNSIRASHFEKSHQIFRTLGNSILYSFIDPIKFISLPLIGFVLLNFKRLRELTFLEKWQNKRWLFLLLWIGIIFMSFAPSLWGMGRRPNERTMNVIVYFHLLGFFPVLCLFLKEIPSKLSKPWGYILLVISLNNYFIVKDFFGPIKAYQERWETIVETKGERLINEQMLPRSIYFQDMERHPVDFKLFLQKRPDFFKEE